MGLLVLAHVGSRWLVPVFGRGGQPCFLPSLSWSLAWMVGESSFVGEMEECERPVVRYLTSLPPGCCGYCSQFCLGLSSPLSSFPSLVVPPCFPISQCSLRLKSRCYHPLGCLLAQGEMVLLLSWRRRWWFHRLIRRLSGVLFMTPSPSWSGFSGAFLPPVG